MPFPSRRDPGLDVPSGWYQMGSSAETSTFAGAGELTCQTRILDIQPSLSR
jgi:hypothetical protein